MHEAFPLTRVNIHRSDNHDPSRLSDNIQPVYYIPITYPSQYTQYRPLGLFSSRGTASPLVILLKFSELIAELLLASVEAICLSNSSAIYPRLLSKSPYMKLDNVPSTRPLKSTAMNESQFVPREFTTP